MAPLHTVGQGTNPGRARVWLRLRVLHRQLMRVGDPGQLRHKWDGQGLHVETHSYKLFRFEGLCFRL